MKFNWRPDAFMELIRGIIPVAVLFGLLHWTPEMQAGATLVVSLVVTFVTVSFLTVDTKTLENAGTSKTQVVEAARANAAAGTPGGTGAPGEPGGSGGTSAPGGLGNMSTKDTRGGTGIGMMLALMLLPALLVAACNRPVSPAAGAATTKDVLALANDVHKGVFDGYVAGNIPGPVADPFMDAVEKGLIPAARKTVVALKAWQAASTVDLKRLKQGDLVAALGELDKVVLGLFGSALPPGINAAVGDTAASIRRSIDAIRQAIADARADASPALALVPAA